MDLSARHGTRQFLTFHVAGGEYAVDILSAREIVPCDAIARVPATPAFLRGVVSLRDAPLPVVDLAVKLGGAETAITSASCIVVTELQLDERPTTMGIIVDAVGRVLDLATTLIHAIPVLSSGLRLDYLTGMTSTDSGFVLFLDLERALASTELLDAVSPEVLRLALERQDEPQAERASVSESRAELPQASATRQPSRRRRRKSQA